MTEYPTPWNITALSPRTIYADNKELILLAPDDETAELIVDCVNNFGLYENYFEEKLNAEIAKHKTHQAELTEAKIKEKASFRAALEALADEFIELFKDGELKRTWVAERLRILATSYPTTKEELEMLENLSSQEESGSAPAEL